MPETTPLVDASSPLTAEEQRQPTAPTDQWTDDYAKRIALADFKAASSFRSSQHDWRFRTSDELYLAWKSSRNWEGTKIPRSKIPIFMALEQIEAMLPQVIGALFSDDDFFDAMPRRNSTMVQAYSVKALLRYQLSDLSVDQKYATLRELVRRCYKQSLIYGNGILEFGWLVKEVQRILYERRQLPQQTVMPHPMTGEPMMLPTGETFDHVQAMPTVDRISQPLFQLCDIRDFYIDQNCSSPNVQDAQHCSARSLKSIDELRQFRGIDGFNIPSDEELAEMAKTHYSDMGDNSKSATETARNNAWNPLVDSSTDPALKRLEVIRYWQRGRHVWLINRKHVAYNRPNEYGMLPFLNAFYIDVPGRFYGISVCDLVEGDQREASAILDARIDELNLMIHSPLIFPRGMQIPQSARRIRPGVMWEVDDMKNAPQRMEMGNVTQEAYIEYAALETRVARKTGNSDTNVMGVAPAGGNSANRTAAGINAQGAATNRRIGYQVENIEDQFMCPLLNVLLALNQKFIDPAEVMKIVGPDGQQIPLDPIHVLNANVRFEMKASSKMKMKAMLQNGGLSLILQNLMNPQLLQMQAQMGFTLDHRQMTELICDTFGIPFRGLYRDMTPQEMQGMMQLNPVAQKAQADRQLQAERLGAMADMQESKDETQLLIATIAKLLDNPEAQKKLTGLAHPDGVDEKKSIEASKPKPKPAGKK